MGSFGIALLTGAGDAQTFIPHSTGWEMHTIPQSLQQAVAQ